MQDGERLRLVRTNRVVRSAAFAYCVLPIGLYLWSRGAGLDNLFLYAAFLGGWLACLGFPPGSPARSARSLLRHAFYEAGNPRATSGQAVS